LIFAFVRSLIGNFGRRLMDFYIQNSLLINSLVLLYGLVVFISRRNYFVILEKLILEIKSKNPKFEKSVIKKISKRDYESISWETVRGEIKFPLFAAPKKWKLCVSSEKKIQEEFTIDVINNMLARLGNKQEN